jgi:hypothetical protein
MRAICRYDNAAILNSRHFDAGYSEGTEFYIEIGREYEIYGITIWGGVISYLVVDKHRQTSFYPADLFELIDSEVPKSWVFRYIGLGMFKVNAVFGYKRLVYDQDHYDALVQHDEGAMSYFFREVFAR